MPRWRSSFEPGKITLSQRTSGASHRLPLGILEAQAQRIRRLEDEVPELHGLLARGAARLETQNSEGAFRLIDLDLKFDHAWQVAQARKRPSAPVRTAPAPTRPPSPPFPKASRTRT